MRKYIGLFVWMCCLCSLAMRAEERMRYRVYLHDKGEAGYSVERPQEFLSPEAIERRAKRGIPITESDLPIARAYLDTLTANEATPIVSSKWFATVVVSCPDPGTIDRISQLSIVDSVRWIWRGEEESFFPEESDPSYRFQPADTPEKSPYGFAEGQIKMLNGIKLHEAGYRGQGMRVAVIDAGFLHADRISVFDSLRIMGTHNVVFPERSVFLEDEHGTKVLSCLAANTPGIMRGTAPEASYWLIKSEDSRSEYPIEEDYWVAAVEYADSVGVEVISSSLGYFTFDTEDLNYTQSHLDGKTSLISRAATLAADKGILLFTSAGNEGNGRWEKITVPADAEGVLTVGAVTDKKQKSVFSSIGPTADGRVKPDVVALGTGCCVIDGRGSVRYGNGTSFATPILAGLGICLWQALPRLTNREILVLIRQSGSQPKRPDTGLGYGLPDLYKAYKEGLKYEKHKN